MTVYKKDLQREQNAHLATKAKVAELESVYKDLVRSYEELKAAPEKVVVRHVRVVDLSLVSKEELEKALIDAT